jgi:hypothetical protein
VAFSPPLAAKLGVSTAKGLDHVVRETMRAFRSDTENPQCRMSNRTVSKFPRFAAQ